MRRVCANGECVPRLSGILNRFEIAPGEMVVRSRDVSDVSGRHNEKPWSARLAIQVREYGVGAVPAARKGNSNERRSTDGIPLQLASTRGTNPRRRTGTARSRGIHRVRMTRPHRSAVRGEASLVDCGGKRVDRQADAASGALETGLDAVEVPRVGHLTAAAHIVNEIQHTEVPGVNW